MVSGKSQAVRREAWWWVPVLIKPTLFADFMVTSVVTGNSGEPVWDLQEPSWGQWGRWRAAGPSPPAARLHLPAPALEGTAPPAGSGDWSLRRSAWGTHCLRSRWHRRTCPVLPRADHVFPLPASLPWALQGEKRGNRVVVISSSRKKQPLGGEWSILLQARCSSGQVRRHLPLSDRWLSLFPHARAWRMAGSFCPAVGARCLLSSAGVSDLLTWEWPSRGGAGMNVPFSLVTLREGGLGTEEGRKDEIGNRMWELDSKNTDPVASPHGVLG